MLNIIHSKRLILCFALLVVIAGYFWTQSRVPDLDDKALMGGGIVLEDPLSFEATIPVNPADPAWKRIIYSTFNWIMTNRRGMTFGVLFGAGFLTFLRYLPRRSFRNGFANAFVGFFVGAPLGVCVNCAAPIAKGMFSGGARLEMTLAAMIASPTFNVIVLTMLFSLLPFYLAAIKIGLTLAVILIAVPIICRLVPADELQLNDDEVTACIIDPTINDTAGEPTGAALFGFLKDYARDLWFIIKMTVPLMFLAGLLGATFATLVPIDVVQTLPMTPLVILGVALLGVFLPVPIAFDIVFAAALLAAGAPVGLVMVLLFTLGIYSIYSFLIVGGSISMRAGIYLTLTIVVLGFASNYIADGYSKWQIERTLKLLDVSWNFSLVSEASASPQNSQILSDVQTEAGTISMSRTPFQERSPAAQTPFTRMEAWKIGIDRQNTFSISRMNAPYVFTPGSISAADLDNDGDPDVVLVDNYSGRIDKFLNDGSGKFTREAVDIGDIAGAGIVNAAPADLDNDGWLDLFVTVHDGENYILWSDKGRFSMDGAQTVANRDDAILTLSLAFGDLDSDGNLDVVLGNHSGLAAYHVKDERDRNRIVFNRDGKLDGSAFVETAGTPGETLTILLSDMDRDGDLDLMEGNDFDEPDIYQLGDGTGRFERITLQDKVIPISTHTTMSIKTADLDNDLDFEIYVSQIAGRSSKVSERLRMTGWENYCVDIERDDDRADCLKNIEIKKWYPSGAFAMNMERAKKCLEMEDFAKAECAAVVIRDIAIRKQQPELCQKVSPKIPHIRKQCELFSGTPRFVREPLIGDVVQKIIVGEERYADEIPQFFGGNVLLVRKDDGTYDEIAKASNLDLGGWSWDVKIYDFDHDELQDIHVVNGAWQPRKVAPSNVYFSNLGGLKFADTTDEFGLVDYLIAAGTAAADFDNDGDIDEITQIINGPLIANWNNSQTGNSVMIELRDHIGNRYGVGSKVIVHYGNEGQSRQIRELKLSGGFGSFDEPVLHFGLGDHDEIAEIEVEWSTGGKSVLTGPFPVQATYRIERR